MVGLGEGAGLTLPSDALYEVSLCCSDQPSPKVLNTYEAVMFGPGVVATSVFPRNASMYKLAVKIVSL